MNHKTHIKYNFKVLYVDFNEKNRWNFHYKLSRWCIRKMNMSQKKHENGKTTLKNKIKI